MAYIKIRHKELLFVFLAASIGGVTTTTAAGVPEAQLGQAPALSPQTQLADKFVPMVIKLRALSPVRSLNINFEAASTAAVPSPVVVSGSVGGPVQKSDGPALEPAPGPAPNPGLAPALGSASGFEIAPQNYGAGKLGTVNQYSDNYVASYNQYPYRTTGWFTFTTYNGGSFRCSAALISKSILLLAGHCVHKGGGGNAYWIKSGTFYPAYANGAQPYSYATVAAAYTTNGWFNTGSLDQGYDVALAVLNKRANTSNEMGAYTGWLGICVSSCLQTYWQNTEIGYPGNYYNGKYMTEGRHLEYSDGRDYRSGSGMEGGSSGGPHVANLGDLSDTSTNKGQWPYRNVAFAATSWGYTDASQKIQGYSTTSGPGNTNNFKGMWNSACTRARALHGTGSCNLLP